jgi:hypothetical protein
MLLYRFAFKLNEPTNIFSSATDSTLSKSLDIQANEKIIQYPLKDTIQYNLLKRACCRRKFLAQIGSKIGRLVVQKRPPNYQQTEA